MLRQIILDTATTAANTATTGDAATTTQSAGLMEMIVSLLPLILVFVVFYFIMIRPQKKQQKKQAEMRNNLKVGDKVVTIGGICGKISKIKDEYVWIETGMPGAPYDKAFIKFKKIAVEIVENSNQE